MNSHLRRLASESAAYGLVPASSAVTTLVLVPVTTRTFAPASYGVLALLSAMTTLLSIVVVLSLDAAAQRFYLLSDDPADQRAVIATWAWCQLTFSVLLCGLLALAANPISQALLGSRSHAGLLRLGLATVPATALATVTTNWLRIQRRAWTTVFFALLVSGLTLTATLVYLRGLQLGLQSMPLGQLTGALAGTVVAVVLMRGWLDPRRVDTSRLRTMLRYALPLVPASMAVWVVNLLDRYILDSSAGARQVGLYQAANQLAAIVGIATTAFQLAWGPFAFAHATQPDARRTYAGVMLAFTGIGCALCAVVGALAPELLTAVTTTTYAGAASAVPWLAFSFVAVGLMYVAAIGPSIVGRTGAIAVATALGAGLTVVLDLALIPPFGSLGAGIATFAAWAVVPVFLFERGHRVYPVAYPFAPAVGLAVFDLTMAVLLQQLSADNHWQSAGVKLLLLLATVGPVTWWAMRQATRLPQSSVNPGASLIKGEA